ncbi:MAG: OmpH family outer membrane protein [Brevundimonas sp.]|uniref:OmpH family outer membrane protein n=1 Tax=Brevundimonas sp. TaxID=1871086 RepID=UPI00271FE0EA|nr:OmpH family outer membrane protein [Brevundimonas sp.]MDO9586326.1 OmpH family outer membrane protein [Brevundimonas sp.]MDP3368632.1 OmpH family outer membrane protein [Brevundimonas sp.]
MKLFAIGAFALASLAAGSAAAQAQAPANPGPVIAGVCVFHNDRLLAQSTAGQSVQAGMQRLVTEVQGELTPYAAALQSEAQRLQQGGQAADPDGSAGRAFQQRAQEAQLLEQTRQQELQYTQQMQIRAIAQAADPILVAVYQERGCGLLLDRSAVYISNPAMDITDLVIQRLNTALPSLSFNRMPVPIQPQQ